MNALYLRVTSLIDHRDEDGQGLAEYALILALIAIIAIVALIFLGGQVDDILSNVGSSGSHGTSPTFDRRGPRTAAVVACPVHQRQFRPRSSY